MLLPPWLVRCAVLVVPAVLSALAAPAHAQCRYQITIIDNSPDTFAFLEAINDRQELCGAYYVTLGPTHALAWSAPAGFIDLPEPPGVYESIAYDISNTPVHGPLGLIVGSMENLTAVRAFKYDGQSMIDLGTLGGLHSTAFAVNSSNWIVGAAGATQSNQAALWRDGRVINIGSELGDLIHSTADDVNALGQVVGGATSGALDQTRAYFWENSVARILPLPSGATYSRAIAINSQGDIAIGAAIPYTDQQYQGLAFIYSGGLWIPIPALGKQDDWPGFDFVSNTPSDINDAGVVVGRSHILTGLGLPYIFQNGVIRRLDQMTVGPDDPDFYLLREVHRINNLGQITGSARNATTLELKSVLLTPVPALPGDTNCDQQVNIDDLTDVILNWQNVGGGADLNFDQSVDVLDLAQVVENWSASK